MGGRLVSVPLSPPKNSMKTHGKKYKAAKALVTQKIYTLDEAVALLKKTSITKFDGSCEVHVNLGIDPKKSDQMVRSTVALPHGTGKEVRVIAFVGEDKVKECKAAGAVKAGGEDLAEEIAKGWLEFDVAIATPDMMKALGKISKILGPKGLMPNPKAGTVTTDVINAIGQIKKGKVEFKSDKFGVVHNMFGKVSFGEKELKENLLTLLKALNDSKPASVKGVFIEGVSLATTMGPGITVDSSKTLLEQLK
ncbi:MAG: 50S ribosomal protein L1, large subunit ribosomal protein L1 [Candidatus Peregrinibacteria bacterium GW2011_GWF2_38_29]|nr:MAG: 50S ribosomal protein L1, large subunit ribosomal protein L1 [Candidatus Peregrinibacteria bacterium GW2011_GWF2_38_29]